ncbi:hypothetical protein ACLOJK_040728 [Asimina triloba]
MRHSSMELHTKSGLLRRRLGAIPSMVREVMLHRAGYRSSVALASKLNIGKVVAGETPSSPEGFRGTCSWGADDSVAGRGPVVVTLSGELWEALLSSCSSGVNHLVSTSMGGSGT